MNLEWLEKAATSMWKWATTDPTPEERAAEISAKTVVGQWMTHSRREEDEDV